MKENSQKILLLTYGLPKVDVLALKEAMGIVLPSVSVSGKNSLVLYLRKQQYLYLDSFSNTVSLTQQGKRLIEGLFPAFNDKEAKLSLLCFLEPPKHDPQFRTLRRMLLSKHSRQLARGLYLTLTDLPDELKITLERLYRSNVVVITIDDWVFGDQNSILASVFDKVALTRTYSGISRETDQLISVFSSKKALTQQNKEKLLSVFSHFFNVIQTDSRLKEDDQIWGDIRADILGKLQKLLFYRPTQVSVE